MLLIFFAEYVKISRSQYGLDGVGEWHQPGIVGEEEHYLGGDMSCEIVVEKL